MIGSWVTASTNINKEGDGAIIAKVRLSSTLFLLFLLQYRKVWGNSIVFSGPLSCWPLSTSYSRNEVSRPPPSYSRTSSSFQSLLLSVLHLFLCCCIWTPSVSVVWPIQTIFWFLYINWVCILSYQVFILYNLWSSYLKDIFANMGL